MKRARFTVPGMLAIAADSWGVEFDCKRDAREPFEERGEFAVVSISGPLTQRATWLWDSYEEIGLRVDAALESAMPALLLRLSSPGGEVAGVFELASEIRRKAAERGKRVVAYVDGMTASAAYALACAADRIFVPSTGLVGSVGCMLVSVDQTKADRAMGLGFEIFTSGSRKADGNPHVEMTGEARETLQARVDELAVTFFGEVARARDMTTEAVAALDAALFVGAKAVEAGLADEVMTFAEVIASGGQVTAQKGPEENMTEEEKARASLKAIAEGDDEKAAARAKAALKALDEEEEKAEEEEAKAKAKAEEEEEEAKAKAKAKDEEEEGAKASASGSVNLAVRVAQLEAQAQRGAVAELVAKHADRFTESTRAWALEQSLAVVQSYVRLAPKVDLQAPKAETPVRGEGAGQGSPSPATAAVEAEVDRAFGIRKPPETVGFGAPREGLRVLTTMTPSEARERAGKA